MLIQSTPINIVDTIQWLNNVTTLWFYVEYEIKVRADKMHGWFKIPSLPNELSLSFLLSFICCLCPKDGCFHRKCKTSLCSL